MANNDKRKQVLKWIQSKKNQIVLLQETHSTRENEPLWLSDWTGNIIFSHGTSNSKGVCILIDRLLPYAIFSSVIDPGGRYVILDIEINGVRHTLANIYGPNEDDENFYLNIIHLIEAIPNDHRIIGVTSI